MGIEGVKTVREVVEKKLSVAVEFPSITSAEEEIEASKRRQIEAVVRVAEGKVAKLHSVYQGLATLHAAGFDGAIPDKYLTYEKTLEVSLADLPKVAKALGSALIKQRTYPVDSTVKRGRQPSRMPIWIEFVPKHFPGITIKVRALSKPGQCSIQKGEKTIFAATYSLSCK